jgi:hypothetical protein
LVLGFGSETICPSREIGEAIPVFHLQVLALWFREGLLEKISFSDLGREGVFPLARVKSWAFSFELGASSIFPLRVDY